MAWATWASEALTLERAAPAPRIHIILTLRWLIEHPNTEPYYLDKIEIERIRNGRGGSDEVEKV